MGLHRKTLRKLAARLDRVEANLDRPCGSVGVIEGFADAYGSGRLGPGYAAAYERYCALVEEVAALGDRPPPAYRSGLPEATRLYVWRRLDHPRLAAVTD